MSQEFNTAQVAMAERSKLDLSFPVIGTLDFGRLQPIFCKEVINGDEITINVEAFTRCAPLATPTNGKLKQHLEFFFVPSRILSEDYNLFIEGLSETKPANVNFLSFKQWACPQYNTSDVTEANIEKIDMCAITAGLGFPINAAAEDLEDKNISLLPHRAYQRIWWDWYRDSQLIKDDLESTYCPKTNGTITIGSGGTNTLKPRYRSWKKDQLTTLYDNPNGAGGNSGASAGIGAYTGSGKQVMQIVGNFQTVNSASGSVVYNPRTGIGEPQQGTIPQAGAALQVPIQFIRAANALQKWLERNNIAGGKIIDRLRARYGVAPTDVRLDRSEYLGGSTATFNIMDLVSTSQASGTSVGTPFGTSTQYVEEGTYQGQQTGKGAAYDNGKQITYNAQEAGFIIGIASITPETAYYGGIPKMFMRGVGTPNSDRFDYYTPEMAHVGYEPLWGFEEFVPQIDHNINVEDYDADQQLEYAGALPHEAVGYQPRYQDYRYSNGVMFGDMVRAETQAEMKAYNMWRYIEDENTAAGRAPNANVVSLWFRTINPVQRKLLDRIFAVTNPLYDHFNFEGYVNLTMVRSMPADAVPELEHNGKVESIANGGTRL